MYQFGSSADFVSAHARHSNASGVTADCRSRQVKHDFLLLEATE